MATKNDPGAWDCYADAEPDEPMFVLLGRDRHAPTLVWLWAALREIDGEDAAKVAGARECCAAMIGYAAARGRPVVGIGQAALVGVMDLIRMANTAVKEARNQPTDVEVIRRLLALTVLSDPDAPSAP